MIFKFKKVNGIMAKKVTLTVEEMGVKSQLGFYNSPVCNVIYKGPGNWLFMGNLFLIFRDVYGGPDDRPWWSCRLCSQFFSVEETTLVSF